MESTLDLQSAVNETHIERIENSKRKIEIYYKNRLLLLSIEY